MRMQIKGYTGVWPHDVAHGTETSLLGLNFQFETLLLKGLPSPPDKYNRDFCLQLGGVH